MVIYKNYLKVVYKLILMIGEYKPDLNIVADDWTYVSYNKKDKRNKIKKQKQIDLNETISQFINELENRNDFVYNLLKHHSIYPSIYYDKLSSEIDNYKIILKKIKKSRDLEYFSKKKSDIILSIRNMNKIINEDNFYILIGKGLVENEEGHLLRDLEMYKDQVVKYNNMINSNSDKVIPNILIDRNKSCNSLVSSNKSYVSLFK